MVSRVSTGALLPVSCAHFRQMVQPSLFLKQSLGTFLMFDFTSTCGINLEICVVCTLTLKYCVMQLSSVSSLSTYSINASAHTAVCKHLI